MTAKIETLDEDDLVKNYRAGDSAGALAKRYGVSVNTILRRLRCIGIKVRTRVRLDGIDDYNVLRIIRRYRRGTAIVVLARTYKVQRRTICLLLSQHGIKIRAASEQERIKWSRMSKRQRKTQVAGANADATGMIGRHENNLADALREVGLSVTQQFRVGKYHLDIAIEKSAVAVEVHSRRVNFNNPKARQRLVYLLDLGWTVIHIICRAPPDFSALTDKMSAFINCSSGDHSLRGHYGMIDGQAQPLPARRVKFDARPRIPGF